MNNDKTTIRKLVTPAHEALDLIDMKSWQEEMEKQQETWEYAG